LVEADLEVAFFNLGDARFPISLGLSEKIVVEQEEISRPRFAAVDLRDRTHGARAAFFLRHDAETAREPTAALRKSQRVLEVGIDIVIVVLVFVTDERFDRRIRSLAVGFGARATDNRFREFSPERGDER
jgi:hypothetical protein